MKSSEAPTPSRISRRQIREAVVQLLHAASPKEEESSLPWSLVLANLDGKALRLRARAILHLQQNRPSKTKPFFAQRGKAPALIENFLDDRAAARSLRTLYKAEEELVELFDILRRQLKSEKEPHIVEDSLKQIQEQNLTSLASQAELTKALGSPEACPQPLISLAKSLPPLLESSGLLRSLFKNDLPTRPELKALSEALADRAFLQEEATQLHDLVLTHQIATDKLVTEHLQNFAFDRLAQVDRAVIRLAATELQHCPDIPPAVAINEAIEIARRFGGNDSASFTNGILGKLKTVLSPETEKEKNEK